jgi:hypothetical protein
MTRENGVGFCHPLSPACNGTIGVLKRKFFRNSGRSEFVWHGSGWEFCGALEGQIKMLIAF